MFLFQLAFSKSNGTSSKRPDFAVVQSRTHKHTTTEHLDRCMFYIAHFKHFSFFFLASPHVGVFSPTFSSNPVNKLVKLVEDLKSGGQIKSLFRMIHSFSKQKQRKIPTKKDKFSADSTNYFGVENISILCYSNRLSFFPSNV